MKEHKFNYNWTLKDAIFTKDKGKILSKVLDRNQFMGAFYFRSLDEEFKGVC